MDVVVRHFMGCKKIQNMGLCRMNRWKCVVETGATSTRYDENPRYKEGLYELRDDIFAWMVPNGSWGESNAGLVVGKGESLLVDTLWDVPKTQKMLDAMAAYLKDAPLRQVVNTHADGDHYWGNELVTEAEIITSVASFEEMKKQKPRSMLLLRRIGKILSVLPFFGDAQVGHWFQAMSAPYDFEGVTPTPATCTFEEYHVLDVGGREVQLFEVGPAHTQGDLIVYVPDAKLLFSGDILFLGSTPVMWAGPLDNWFSALDKILEMDVETIVPGHGPVTDKEGVKGVQAYWEYVGKEVQTRYHAGMKASEAAKEIVLSKEFQSKPFAMWNSPERIMVSAHTLYRHLEGRTDSPGIPELLRIMYRQAKLAHELPHAQPAVMRKK